MSHFAPRAAVLLAGVAFLALLFGAPLSAGSAAWLALQLPLVALPAAAALPLSWSDSMVLAATPERWFVVAPLLVPAAAALVGAWAGACLGPLSADADDWRAWPTASAAAGVLGAGAGYAALVLAAAMRSARSRGHLGHR